MNADIYKLVVVFAGAIDSNRNLTWFLITRCRCFFCSMGGEIFTAIAIYTVCLRLF